MRGESGGKAGGNGNGEAWETHLGTGSKAGPKAGGNGNGKTGETARLEAKLIHHTMRSRFHGPIDACRGPCLLAATIQLLNGGLKSTTAERDLL